MGLQASLSTDWLPDTTSFTETGISYNNNFGRIAASLARQEVPVDTGYLQSSISGDSDVVQAEAEYAQYVEYGTWKMDSQPYFEFAVEQAASEMGEEWSEQFLDANMIDSEQFLDEAYLEIETTIHQQLEEAIQYINELFDMAIAQVEAAYAEIPGEAAQEDCDLAIQELQAAREMSIELTTAQAETLETEAKADAAAQVEAGITEVEAIASEIALMAISQAMDSIQIV